MRQSSERDHDPTDFPWSVSVLVDAGQAAQQHVDNLEISRLFHEARLAFNRDLIWLIRGEQHFSDQLIVRILTEFSAEVPWVAKIDVFAGIERVGRSAYDIGLAIFLGDQLAVRCLTVNVWMRDRVPFPVSNEARLLLESLAVLTPIQSLSRSTTKPA